MATHIIDPALYRKLSEPHADVETADAALRKFFDGVRALRAECGVPDVHVIAALNVRTGDESEQQVVASVHNGNVQLAVSMLAWSLGREEAIAAGVAGKMRTKGKAAAVRPAGED